MFDFNRAVLYVRRHGIDRSTLEAALNSGELSAGTLPAGGWVIHAEALEAWVDSQAR